MITTPTAFDITRKSLAARLMLWLVLMQMINLSIDPPDSQPVHMAEDLSVNEIESILELVLEDVCDADRTVPESDENDEEKNISAVRYDLAFGRGGAPAAHMDGYRMLAALQTFAVDVRFKSGVKPETVTPPPKASA